MPGQFINSGNTPNGGIKLTNNFNTGKLNMSSNVYSFTLTSADIVQGQNYNSWNGNLFPAPIGASGEEGFTLTFYSGQPSYLSQADAIPYEASMDSQAIADFFVNLTNLGVLAYPNETTIWNVQWGPGSTYATGVVSMDGIQFFDSTMRIAPLDTTDPTWDQPGNSTTALPGTYKFPATFTLILPVFDKGGWC